MRQTADSLAHIHASVELTNVSSDSLAILLEGCTVLLRLYAMHSDSTEPIWSEGRGPGWRCAQPSFLLRLAPGESRSFSREFPVHWLLVEGLAPARYEVTALLRHTGQALEFATGDVMLRPQHAGLGTRIELFVREEDVSLHAVAWIRNHSTEAQPLEVPSCALRLSLYRTPEMNDPASWRWTPQTLGNVMCPATGLERRTLAPGDSLTSRFLWAGVPVARLLGDSLPPGRYYSQAQLRFNYFDTERISLGPVDLHPNEPSPTRRRGRGSAM